MFVGEQCMLLSSKSVSSPTCTMIKKLRLICILYVIFTASWALLIFHCYNSKNIFKTAEKLVKEMTFLVSD